MRFPVIALAVTVLAAPAAAQDLKRTVMQRVDVPTGVPYETVIGTVEIPPNAAIGRHAHAGFEMIILLEGEIDILLDGDAPRRLKAGDSFVVPAGKVHNARAVSAAPAKVAVTWVVEKGKPMATPAAD